MSLFYEYLNAFNFDVAVAAMILLCVALPLALMVWAMVRNQHREMAMHYCPDCARERPYTQGGACPHCNAPMMHRQWP